MKNKRHNLALPYAARCSQEFHRVNLILRYLQFAMMYNTQFATFHHSRRKLSKHISLIMYDILVNPVFFFHLPPHHQNPHSPEIVDFFPATPDQVWLRQIILASARTDINSSGNCKQKHKHMEYRYKHKPSVKQVLHAITLYKVWQLEPFYIIEQLDQTIIKICRVYRSRFMVRVPPRFMIWCSFWGLMCAAVIISVPLPRVIYNAKETNLIKSFVISKADNKSNPKCLKI